MNLISKKRRVLNLHSSVLTLATAGTAFISVATPVMADEDVTGWIDVYIDHTDLDEAVSAAESAGVNVIHEDSVVLKGDAAATETNSKTARDYYNTKEAEIEQIAAKYRADLINFENEQRRNDQAAANANAVMDALKTNLASNGQTVVVQSKPYNAGTLAQDTAAIEAKIQAGDRYQDLRAAVTTANTVTSSLVSFQTQADQGNIRLTQEAVTVSSQADIDRYVNEMRQEYARLEAYVASLSNSNGSIPASERPAFKTYSFVVDSSVVAAATEPVVIYNYTPVRAERPETPTVSYHYYDIRSTPSTDRHAENADGETIIEASKESALGAKVVQAMVNQIVGVETDNQPLPSERFDKIHNLEIVTHLPANVEPDMALSNIDARKWTAVYDENANTITMKATSRYLVEVNANQNINNAGSVGGTVNGQWDYDAPAVYFKLLQDDTTYQVYSETIVNDEYLVVGEKITIRTDSANPEKHNYNSQFVQIDGKAVLPGSVNNYRILWDFASYKNVNIDAAMQAKDLILADVYNHVALTYNGEASLSLPNGEVVKLDGLEVRNVKYSELDDAQYNGLKAKIEATAKEQAGNVDDYSAVVLVASGVDQAFYKTYVEGGQSLLVTLPMTTNKIDNTPDKQGGTYNGNTYYNVAFQSDFGNDYKSNTVTNNAPLIDPRKDAVASFAQLSTLDIEKNPTAEIEKGSTFYYRLSGSEFPMNLSEDTMYYAFTDEMPVDADEYTGEYIVESNNPIQFKEGTALYNRYKKTGGVLSANSDITKYTTQTVARNMSSTLNTPTGTVEGADSLVTKVIVELDNDFLSQIDWSKTSLQVDAFLKTKRIADIDGVKNVFNEVINSIDFGSTEVVTNSKANATEELKAQLEALAKRQDEDDADDQKFQSETTSALSVIVKSIQDNKAAQEDADAKLEDKIIENTTNIAKNTASVEAVQKLVAALRANVDSNKEAIDANKGAIEMNKNQIAENSKNVAIITELANKAVAQSEAKFSNLTIYDLTVTSDAEALAWATNHGVAAGSIKSITLDNDGRFVVRYNVSETATNGSKPATTNTDNVNQVAMKRKTISLYTAKTEAEAYSALEALGYKKEQVSKLTNSGTVFTALIVGNKAEVVKSEVKPEEKPVEQPEQTELKSVEDAAKFNGSLVKVAGAEYQLVKAVSVSDKSVAFTAKPMVNGKVTANTIRVVIPKSVVLRAKKTEQA